MWLLTNYVYIVMDPFSMYHLAKMVVLQYACNIHETVNVNSSEFYSIFHVISVEIAGEGKRQTGIEYVFGGQYWRPFG
jgi:hypothetical protein